MVFSGLARRLPGWWYRRDLVVAVLPLLPLSWLFLLLTGLRRLAYRIGACSPRRLPVPVVVVGNLTVGGSGKTPLVLWLISKLRERGWRPGIVSRGYGSRSEEARPVLPTSTSSDVGDEPLLLARRSDAPVFVGRDRVAAARALLAKHPDCNLIVSDDGLQHYRLPRDVELVVFDARGAGNGRLLPAGPLREPLSRLCAASAVVWNGSPEPRARRAACALPQFEMRLVGQRFVALGDMARTCDAEALRKHRLHALAGIGEPRRFFQQLAALGLDFEEHPFPDHHPYRRSDLDFARGGVLLMTEKDAVKCETIVPGEAWFLPIDAEINAPPGHFGLLDTILEKLHGRPPA